MQKRKTGFNIIDALIIILVAAVGIGIYFIFFGNKGVAPTTDSDEPQISKVRYVLQVNQLPADYFDNIKVGETVIDYGTHTDAGTVVAVDYENYVYVGHDKTTGEQKLTPVEDSINLYVTVEGEAVMENESYYINDTSIYVGKRLDMMMPDLFCCGNLISLEIID